MVNVTIIGLAICLLLATLQVQAQSRCDTACANDSSCSSNQCVLTSCADTTSCYQYCLRCNEIETCYGNGPSCPITVTKVANSTNKLSSSILLSFFYIIFLCVTKMN